MTPTFEIYEGKDEKWYWRLKAANGEIVASGQGYSSADAAEEGVEAVKRAAAAATIKFVNPE